MEDHNIKQKGGAIGFFTEGIMERKDFYMVRLTIVLVSFVNEELYFE